MKKVFKLPIILSILAASAFSIIGSEPVRANKLIKTYKNCKLMEMDSGSPKYKVKNKNTGELYFTHDYKDSAKSLMQRSDTRYYDANKGDWLVNDNPCND